MDLHTHTVASVHAYSTIMENAKAGKTRNLQILGISDHGYGMPQTTAREYWMNLHCLPPYVEGIRLLRGMESNIANRKGEILEEDIFPDVDYVIASIHGNCYSADTGDLSDYTEAACNAMRNPRVKILGHPDDSRYPMDYEAVVKTAIECGVALEVNNSSVMPYSYRRHAADNIKKYLGICKSLGCRIIVNSDAHIAEAVGDFRQAEDLLREVDFPEELVVNTSWRMLEELLGMEL